MPRLTLGHLLGAGDSRGPSPPGSGVACRGALWSGKLLFQLRGVHSIFAAKTSCVSVTASLGPIRKGD